jgi:hypothetical protein
LTDEAFGCLRRHLARQVLDDAAFDAMYAGPIQAKSASFWTPLAVASRAAALFALHGARRVLDVGSGPGKFCLAAGCMHPDLDFVGIEHRAELVSAACLAQSRLGLENVGFLYGDATRAPWDRFDGLYLFNPFSENLCDHDEQLDNTVELSTARYMSDVRRVAAALATAAVGNCVVTYHGFGGPIPSSYELIHAERAQTDWLRVWIKQRPTARGDGCFVERGDDVLLVSVVLAGDRATDVTP